MPVRPDTRRDVRRRGRLLGPVLLAAALAALPGLAAAQQPRAGAAAQASPGGSAAPQAAPGGSATSQAAPGGSAAAHAFQGVGPFPTNAGTDRAAPAPDNGADGMRASVGALQQALTELQALQLQTKQAHWNVSGTLFYPLHELLQEHYEGISALADRVAERLLAIGASADGRARTIVESSRVGEFPGGFVDDAQVIAWFAAAYRQVALEVRQGIRATEDPDPTTSNLLQEVELQIAKDQWQMRAHLQPTPTDPNTGADIANGQAVQVPGGAGPSPQGGAAGSAPPAR